MERQAILIPGGGLNSDGSLPEWVRLRFDRALALYAGEWLMPLSAGTTHKPPPLDKRGFPIFEAQAGAVYLLEKGIPREKILVEASSYDTIGNAYFARVLHCDPRGLRRLHVITSAFHLPRTEAVFRWVFGLDVVGAPYQLTFEATPDAGIAPDVLAARVVKEQEGSLRVAKQRAQYDSLAKLHQFLFTEHSAYRTQGDNEAPAVDPRALGTY